MSSSHVVVLDSTARRAVVKVTPSTHLSDVLQEACSKLKLNASHYGLRNNNKQVDLSRTIRLSGLSSGAKLELVLLSRSPSVVSVALQLPDTEVRDGSASRLVEKFPSTTTLWLVLRKFESGSKEGGGARYNFTARGVPQTADGTSGSGRLVYETPVLHVMGRELSTFTDLQKSLGQLGLNSGSVLLRLSFRVTQTPLEEAMGEIEQYFKSIDTHPSSGAHSGSVATAESTAEVDNPDALKDGAAAKSPPQDSAGVEEEVSASISQSGGADSSTERQLVEEEPLDDATVVGPDQRPISIFAPPSDPLPQASKQAFNEADYELSIDQAKQYQSHLSISGRNKRLPSEAEIKAREEANSRKRSSFKEVEIKIRYPDQTQVVSKFTSSDTVCTLYDFVRSMIHHDDQPFLLSYSSTKGATIISPADGAVRLIADLGFSGRMLLNFLWDEKASHEARLGAILKTQFATAARPIRVDDVEAASSQSREGPSDGGSNTNNDQTSSQGMGQGRSPADARSKRAMPKWLKLPGKK